VCVCVCVCACVCVCVCVCGCVCVCVCVCVFKARQKPFDAVRIDLTSVRIEHDIINHVCVCFQSKGKQKASTLMQAQSCVLSLL